MNSKFTIVSLWLVTLLCVSAKAQDSGSPDTVDIYSMALEELMSIKVISSTKTEVSIQKAPSVIRMFTANDISKFGYQTVREILDQIPGFEIQEYRAGHQLTWIRGVQARYNNKVLLLIDGVPMRDSYYGNFNIDEMIPIAIIDRIEIINGPGSVLYGANSFSGVISITTKQEGKSISAQAGSFRSYALNGQYNYKGLFANAKFFKTDGFAPDLNMDGSVRQHDQSAINQSVMASYNRGGLQLTGGYTHYNYPYTYRDAKSDYNFTRKPAYGSAAYQFKLNDFSSIKVHGFYNHFGFTIDKTKYTSATSTDIAETAVEVLNSSLYGGNAEIFVNLKKNELVGGISLLNDRAHNIHAQLTSDAGTPVDVKEPMIAGASGSFTRSNLGLFAQNSYSVTDKVNITAGVRYDVLSDFDDQFNYRIGVTSSFTENLYGKMLYGTAYRVPAYREYLDVASYNDNLQPEKLKTLEAQVGYVSNKMDINLSLYHNYYTDFISEVVVDSVSSNGVIREVDDEISFNFDNRSITGLEFNGVLKPVSQWSFILGLSYKLRATETMGGYGSDDIIYSSQAIDFGKRDLMFLSKFTGNFTASYSFGQRARVSLSGQYFSKRNTPTDYQADVDETVQQPTNADGFCKFNFFGNVRVVKGLHVNASINNIFDTAIYSPPFGAQREYDAQWPGRVFRVGVQYSF